MSAIEWNWGKYVADELKFLKLLDKEILCEFKFRRHPLHKVQWKNDERIMKELPSIKFDDESKGLYESLKKAKLVISEVLGSGFMESIAVGKPAIVLFNPKELYVEVNENYVDIEDMIRVGLIAETPEKLAATVNQIYDNVDSWWNDSERQEVVRRFRDKYLFFTENAEEMWIEKITSYVV